MAMGTTMQFSTKLEKSSRILTYITFYALIVYELIDEVRSDSRLYRCPCYIKNFSSKPADLAHRFLLFLSKDRNLVPVDKHLL